MPYLDRLVASGTIRGPDRDWIAESYVRAGRPREAIDLVRDDARGLTELARILHGRGDAAMAAAVTDQALAALEKQPALQPGDESLAADVADLLISAGRTADAVRLLTEASLQSPDNSGLSLKFAETLSRAGKFAEAAQAARAHIEPEAGTHDSLGHMILAAVLLAAGDHEAYRAACVAAVERFNHNTPAHQAEHIAKSCLLAADSGVEAATLAARVASAQDLLTKPQAACWVQLVNALAEYRLGHWDASADWAAKLRANPKAPLRAKAAGDAVLAMAEHRRQHREQAAAALLAAKTAVAANWPEGGEGPWHAWLIAELLAKEAAALIEEQK